MLTREAIFRNIAADQVEPIQQHVGEADHVSLSPL